MRYNPPPNWPPPPSPDWRPPENWGPDPAWGPPPTGWELWLEDAPSTPGPSTVAPEPDPAAPEPASPEPDAPPTTTIPTTAIRAATAYSEVQPTHSINAPWPPDGWQIPIAPQPEPRYTATGFDQRPTEYLPNAAPPKKSSSVMRALKHPVWISLGTLIAVAGLIVTYFQVRQDGSASAGSLEFAAVTLQNPEPIKAVTYDVTNPSATTPVTDRTVTPIDITIKNNGGTAAHIGTIKADVLIGENVDCGRQGGETRVSAEYSLTIPFSQAGGVQKNVSAPIDFTVQPGSTDRMVVTVGLSEETHVPFALAVKLTLVPDSGPPMQIEPMALINPYGVDNEMRMIEMMGSSADFKQCVTEKQQTIDGIYTATKVQSPDLNRLRDAYAQVIA